MDYQGIQSCLLPTLSCLSVSIGPGGCLRHRCSSTSLRISLLHVEFHLPLPYSSLPVTYAVPRLSPGIFLPIPSSTPIIYRSPFFSDKSALQPEGLLHTRGIAGSGLPPLSKIPHCCLP